jgi:hypothetical protein
MCRKMNAGFTGCGKTRFSVDSVSVLYQSSTGFADPREMKRGSINAAR